MSTLLVLPRLVDNLKFTLKANDDNGHGYFTTIKDKRKVFSNFDSLQLTANEIATDSILKINLSIISISQFLNTPLESVMIVGSIPGL